MQVHTTIAALRHALAVDRSQGHTIGLVPTMGFLHDGHVSLIERARADNDSVVVTIFVNPLQFAPGEDLASYPRDPDGDAAKATAAGAAHLFCPDRGEMYPEAVRTTVTVGGVADTMEGAMRPTHFAGVATVVAKLFSITGDCRAYFGEKDYQQLAVISTMARDLSMPVEVIGCPIVREPDGLAMSSRNVYLTPDERAAAPVLRRALAAGAALVGAGETSADAVRNTMVEVVRSEPLADLDYAEVADPRTLEPAQRCHSSSRLLVAATFGRARLIDNVAAGDR